MEPVSLSRLVADKASELGFDLVGIAPAGPSPDYERFQGWLAAGYDAEMAYLGRRAVARADPRKLLPAARSVIVLGANYHVVDLPAGLREDPSRGLIASYAWGADYHEVLKPLLFQLDGAIRTATGRTSQGRAYVDTGPVLERSWAQAAGLGFIGKNTCLIAPRLGSWLFLAVLIVPEAFDNCQLPSNNRQLGTCGACTRCLRACPTGAFPAAHALDSRRCISYLTIEHRGPIPHDLRPLLGNWIFGCDICQEVCPYNRQFARPALAAALQPKAGHAAPRLLDLLALDAEGFRRRFRGSPVKRAGRRGLLRNVCVALGNWGHAEAVPGLIEALKDEETLIRGHAAWALGRIGTAPARRALATRAEQERDGWVVGEIAQALRAASPSADRRPTDPVP